MYSYSRHPTANGNGHVLNISRDEFLAGMQYIENQIYSMRQLSRMPFGQTDPRRDLNAECGYPEDINIDQYRNLWKREPIAARVVELMPRECWCVQPTIYEEEDAEDRTEFETGWDELGKQLKGKSYYKEEEGSPVWEYLKRADELSGIGSYGVILLGFDDKPATEWRDEVKSAKKLLYVRCLDEKLAPISSWETDPASPRFGQPLIYSLTMASPEDLSQGGGIGSPENTTLDVHWSRIIHVADNLATSEVIGLSRMHPVFNRLCDLQKLYGGSAEMYWKGAFFGLSFETHPQLGGDVEIDVSGLRDQAENYFNTLQRYVVGKGMAAKPLAPQVSDPTPQIQVQLEAICIKLEVPMRIFMGSERGELASSQDEKGWKKRVAARQRNYLTPRLIVPFVDRLIKVGVLPEPKEGYCVHWPDMFALSETEQADIGLKIVQGLAQYTQGGCDVALPLDQFYSLLFKFKDEDVEAIMDKLLEQAADDSNEDKPDSPLLGLVGGLTGMIELYKACKEQAISEEQFRGICKIVYKLDDAQIDELIADGMIELEPEPVAPTLPMKVGEGQALIHPETGQTIGKGPPKSFPPARKVANRRLAYSVNSDIGLIHVKVGVFNAKLTGGRWITTDEGNRVYLKDGKAVAGNPHVVKEMNKGDSTKEKPKKKSKPEKKEATKESKHLTDEEYEKVFSDREGPAYDPNNQANWIKEKEAASRRQTQKAKALSKISRETATAEDVEVVKQYSNTKTQTFADLNKNLREGNPLTPDQAKMDSTLDRLTHTEIPLTAAYRGVQLRPEDAEKFLSTPVGSEISLPGFQSSSINPGSATTFAVRAQSADELIPDKSQPFGVRTDLNGRKGVMFQIATKKGFYIPPEMHSTDAEKELLLPKNGKYRVVGVDRSAGWGGKVRLNDGTIAPRHSIPVIKLEHID